MTFKFLLFALVLSLRMPSASAEIKFETKRIKLGGRTIVVEIADNDEKRSRGLMFRESLAEDRGMLFIFEYSQELRFWMKNTLIPLSIGYFDEKQTLVETLEMVPAVMGEARPQTYPSSRPVKFALEMPKRWFERHKIRPGAKFEFAK